MKKLLIFSFAIAIIAYGVYLSGLPIYLKIVGKTTSGTVVEMKRNSNNGGSNRDIQSRKSWLRTGKVPSVKFKLDNQKDSLQFWAKGGGLFKDHYQIGEAVPVVYDEKNPNRNALFTLTELGSGIFIIFFGTILLFAIKNRK